MSTVLLIEDETELARVAQSYLEKAGFQVIVASRGDTGLTSFKQHKPDLVLLDLNLPGMDGLDVAREIRRQSDVPLIMVTARVEETDRLIGLELGADDYIVKPYSVRELVARVRAVLRRFNRAAGGSQILHEGDLEVDLDTHTVRKGESEISLTPTEFQLLSTLMMQPGRVFTRMQLLESLQGVAYEGYERTIDAHIKNLRAKIEDDPRHPRYIETVFGVGYRFRKG
ncbi:MULTISPECIES: response regulator transcription factor [Anaerolinea]|jgi:two-component system alkaline phosphatase synthesis response regulator PhoP|uniref:response regulator transcription factor n=1 Tax=Anaerolinea TaxID=233189 RepID=UPI002623DCB6|nr:response regulator transcription factor [Anaerolinea thermophila]